MTPRHETLGEFIERKGLPAPVKDRGTYAAAWGIVQNGYLRGACPGAKPSENPYDPSKDPEKFGLWNVGFVASSGAKISLVQAVVNTEKTP